MEKKSSKKLLVIVLIITALVLLFYGGDAFMEGGMMNDKGWIDGNYWRWFPSIVTLSIGVLIGWLLFKRVKNHE